MTWSWWIWLLLILVLLSLIVLIVWLLRLNARASRRRQEAAWTTAQAALRPAALTPVEETLDRLDQAPAAVEIEETAAEAAAEVEEAAVETVKESAEQAAGRMPDAVPIEQPLDDLKIIEGIGPKISGVLQAAGIRTLAQLAATDVDELKRVLTEADIRLGDPGTWPEQAGLAAEGKWDELAALQDELKGGRRV